MTEELDWSVFETPEDKLPPPSEDNDSIYTCKCGEPKFQQREGLVCASCGLVDTHNNIQTVQEWTSGVDENGTKSVNQNRCGMAPDLALFSEKWSLGTRMSGNSRMARIHLHSSMNHRDRSLFHAYKEFDRAGLLLHLPAYVIRHSKILYRKFTSEKKNLTRAAVRKGIKANCLFVAAKQNKCHRTTKEIAEAFNTSTTNVGRTSDKLTEDIDCSDDIITGPIHVIARLLNPFDGIEGTHVALCEKACKYLDDSTKLMGKTPNAVASAIIFVIFDGCVTKQEICINCKVSIPTLNKLIGIVKEELKDFKYK